MTDVTEFVAAVVAIAKDPKAFEKRLGDAAEAAEKLSEARKLRKEADDDRKIAAADRERAEYEHGQAEHARREVAQQSAANAKHDKELEAREKAIAVREQTHETNAASLKRDLAQ